jgi:cation diffusion facilitator CzcD-associated flavoprotein CzcO
LLPRRQPAWEPQDAGSFQGVQLPAASFTSAALAVDKDVVVVGGGKSALDIAAAAATTARSVVILRRKVHWPLAPFVGGIIP